MRDVSVRTPVLLDGADALTMLRWFGIVRLGLVQASLGAIVVLVTSTLNRVMVVEFALPAVLPGALVALHYAVQLVRPRFGFQSDRGGRQTPWILGGMCVLAMGGTLCAWSVVLIASRPLLGVGLAVVGYATVGLGVGAAGTSLLLLLSRRVAASRRAGAATLMWVLMIAGFAITSTSVGRYLDPFSPRRLIFATAGVGLVACLVAVLALWSVEGRSKVPLGKPVSAVPSSSLPAHSFLDALRSVWDEPAARRFTLFVFASMLAYSAQELLLEPFAGVIFGYSVGGSAQLSGLWHFAALVGMIVVGIACSNARRAGTLRHWTIGGCLGSAAGLLGLVGADLFGPLWPLRVTVVMLGIANGTFAVAAIASMMEFAADEAGSVGVRLGLWGAAQAIAFAVGGLFATAIVDSARHFLGSPRAAFGIVFLIEAVLFIAAARFVTTASRRPGRETTEGWVLQA